MYGNNISQTSPSRQARAVTYRGDDRRGVFDFAICRRYSNHSDHRMPHCNQSAGFLCRFTTAAKHFKQGGVHPARCA
jgi:hypothetical protein